MTGYADSIRSSTCNMNDVATLIEGVVGSSGPLVFSNWTPGFTGFSVSPGTVSARYVPIGDLVIVQFHLWAPGTSNSTAFTITGLPVSAAGYAFINKIKCYDHGAWLSNWGEAGISGTTISLYTNTAGGGWTDHDGKAAIGLLVYEAA